MQHSDFHVFEEHLIRLLLGLTGKSPDDALTQAWWHALEDLPISAVLAGLDQCLRTETGRPVPGKIRQIIDGQLESLWLSADCAWSQALVSQDEFMTVVWTEEAATAFADAKPLLDSGDKIGARMAFKATYERMVRNAVARRNLPKAKISFGWSKAHRKEALERAVSEGLLERERATYLLQWSGMEIGEDETNKSNVSQAIVGLLAGKNDTDNIIPHPCISSDPERLLEFNNGIALLKKTLEENRTESPGERRARESRERIERNDARKADLNARLGQKLKRKLDSPEALAISCLSEESEFPLE